MNKNDIKNDKKVAFSIALKYNQLKRDTLTNLEVNQLVNYLFKYKWKDDTPDSVASAIVEIMNADAGNIVAYLSNDAVVKSKNNKLSDFNDLFGWDLN